MIKPDFSIQGSRSRLLIKIIPALKILKAGGRGDINVLLTINY